MPQLNPGDRESGKTGYAIARQLMVGLLTIDLLSKPGETS